jgi:hypothetical protein
MKHEELKFILGAYRPGGRGTGDPAVAEALAQVERDPQLRRWFERDQAFGSAVTEKLRAVAPPPGLRDAILAGARLGQKLPWWRRQATLAMAAAAAVMIALTPFFWRFTRPAASKTLPEFALNFAGRGFIGLQERGSDVQKLQAWLATRHAPLPAKIPTELAELRGLGCRTVDFQGKNISLICFEQGHEFHLFVARRGDFPTLVASAQPQFRTGRAGWAAAAWSDEEHHYVLVSDAGEAAIKRLL